MRFAVEGVGDEAGPLPDLDPVWKIVCSSPQADPRSGFSTVTITRAMKHSASSFAGKRQARNLNQLARQTKPKGSTPSGAAKPLDELTPVHRRAAGIDVGSAENYVAIPASGLAQGEESVRVFGVFSAEQDALVEWLHKHQITTVAMEATGYYWWTLHDKLEQRGIEVYVVDPHSVRTVPGRKSDWLDCQWLQKLHTYGLLSKAFRPDLPIRRLRTLTRQRTELVINGAAHQQHMGKVLVAMNLQLGLVVSDLIGETGLRIIEAILAGQRDPEELVKLRDPRCKKSTIEEMKAALRGTYNDEDLFVLEQSLAGWRFYQQQMVACDQRIAKALAAIPQAPPATKASPAKPLTPAANPRPKAKRIDVGNNSPTINFTEALVRICGMNLMKVCGLNLLSVLMLIGEIGTDMSRWRSSRAFCSWLGLCPGAKISGGKVLSRRTRNVKNRASTILRLAAWAVSRTDTWIGSFYRRIQRRRGTAKAVTATARKLACVIYHLLKYREEFLLFDTVAYGTSLELQRLTRLRTQAREMGYELKERQELHKLVKDELAIIPG